MSNYGSLPVKTATAGDVAVKLVDTGGVNEAAIDAHGSLQLKLIDATGANVLAVDAHGSAPSTLKDASGAAVGTSGNPLFVDAVLEAGTAIVGKVGIDQTTPGTTNGVQITGPGAAAGTPLYFEFATGAAGLAAASPLFVESVSGSVIKIDQTTPGTTNGVQIAGGPGTSSGNPIYVNTGTGSSGTPKNSGQLKSAQLAAASSATLSAAAITSGKTGNLAHVVCSSSGAGRFDIQAVSPTNVVTTIASVYTTAANPNAEFSVYLIGEVAISGADGTNAKYQVVVTNNDANALDYYAYISWTEQ